MAGALSTLGLGSQGVLTNDILDQLKEADQTATIDPIERSQKSLTLQQAGLVGLKDAVKELEELATSLSDLALYQGKKTELVGESVTVEATSSAQTQSFDISVSQLATKDIHQSTGFASKTDPLTAGSITVDGIDITIEATDTLETLAEKITEATDGNVEASILNVGGNQPYSLILKSKETGTDSSFTISGDINFTEINDATNASLTIDNIAVESQSNTLTELIEGATINLTQTGDTRVDIQQDSEGIVEKMESFVEKYNALIDSVTTLTNYNEETKVAGVFQSSSEIRGMMGPIKDIFNTSISDIGKMSEDFGLSSSRDGRLTFDATEFSDALAENSTEIQNFFIGEGEEEGVFRALNTQFFDIATSSDGIFKTLDSNYTAREQTLADSLERAQERLDNKYEIMQKKFASYDAVIGRLSNASSMLQNMIDAQSGNN